MFITFLLNRQEGSGQHSWTFSLHSQPLIPAYPHPNSYPSRPRALISLTVPDHPHGGAHPTLPIGPEALFKLSPGSSCCRRVSLHTELTLLDLDLNLQIDFLA